MGKEARLKWEVTEPAPRPFQEHRKLETMALGSPPLLFSVCLPKQWWSSVGKLQRKHKENHHTCSPPHCTHVPTNTHPHLLPDSKPGWDCRHGLSVLPVFFLLKTFTPVKRVQSPLAPSPTFADLSFISLGLSINISLDFTISYHFYFLSL